MVLGASDLGLAPAYQIKVQRILLNTGVTDLIDRVEYESADGIADMMRVRVYNPDSVISDSKLFQNGNELELWGGYGPKLEFIGAAIINTSRGRYPEGQQPSLEVVGYSRDHLMMDNAPPEAKKGKKSGKKGKGGRIFKDAKYSNAVEDKAIDYSFKADIDETPDAPHDFIQKAGMNDYEFVQGLANLTGYTFWVDRDEAGQWTLHFKSDKSIASLQEKTYTFEYGIENATLLSFEPEMKFTGSHTKLVARVKNAQTGKLLKTVVEDGSPGKGSTEYAGRPDDKIKEPPPSAGGVKLFLGEFSVDVQTTKKFTTEAELKLWADTWFARNRNNFSIARGRTVGIEGLLARQVHTCKGVGMLYSGEYQFDRVKHIFDANGGYSNDWHGRKVLPSP